VRKCGAEWPRSHICVHVTTKKYSVVTMHFNVESRTILLVKHGSHAYGTNIEGSDEDFKGVCIKPKECYFGFMQKFEQHEHMGSKSDGVDKVIYSLEKFASLAAECNPNIIEVLHVDESDVLNMDEFGEQLRSIKDDFLSKKAKFTFAGYAHAQLHRIKTHRAWLLNPPKSVPDRKDFGLLDSTIVSKSELGAFNSMNDQGCADDLPKSVVSLFVKEKAYQAAKTHYDQYINWVKTRNPARAEFEAKFGFDVKHGMHLIRLMRMCKEILVTGKVQVKRPDREELLAIRHGKRSYDDLVGEAEQLEAECDALYETSILPRESNRTKINSVIVDMTERYLRLHG
jgi:predicted nucleotidyltransferase